MAIGWCSRGGWEPGGEAPGLRRFLDHVLGFPRNGWSNRGLISEGCGQFVNITNALISIIRNEK